MRRWTTCCIGAVVVACLVNVAAGINIEDNALTSRAKRKASDFEEFLRLLSKLGSGSSSSAFSASSESSAHSGDSGSNHHRLWPHDRILDGVNTDIRTMPYIVQLGEEGVMHCSAVIIGRPWAITTGTCTYSQATSQQFPVSSLTLRAGTTDRDSGGQVYRVVRMELHPKFDFGSQNFDYDFALLQLRGTGFQFSSRIKTIDMARAGQRIPGNANALVGGWGQSDGGGQLSDKLQSTTIKTVPFTDCVKAFLSPPVTERMLCAGDGTRGPCQGDEGGPLVMDRKLIGLSSWGYEQCSATGHPGVYARVPNPDVRNWIMRITNL